MRRILRTCEAAKASGLTGSRIRALCQSQVIRATRDPGPNYAVSGRMYWSIPMDAFMEWLSRHPTYLARALLYFEAKDRKRQQLRDLSNIPPGSTGVPPK